MAHFSERDLIEEIHWEHQLVQQGVTRYEDSITDSTLAHTEPGHRLSALLIPTTAHAIDQIYTAAWDAAVEASSRAKKPAWHWVLGMLPSNESAAIAIQCILRSITARKRLSDRTGIALEIGDAIEIQVDYHLWQRASADEAEEGHASVADKLIQSYGHLVNRKARYRWKETCESFEAVEWSKSDKLVVGMKLLKIVLDSHPDVFKARFIMRRGERKSAISLNEDVWAEVDNLNQYLAYSRPFLLPTIIEPQPWHYDAERETYVGGYWHLRQPLFTKTIHEHTAADPDAPSADFLTAINQVQKTKWRINKQILRFLTNRLADIEDGSTFPSLPQLPAAEPPTRMSDVEWDTADDATRSKVKQDRRLWHERQEAARGAYSSLVRKIKIAQQMVQFPEFYFPHFSDFRGRLYPMPQELNPQGDHICKGLLEFAEGKRLGADGLYWLQIHLANCAGQDKLTFPARVQWVEDNMKLIRSIAKRPTAHESFFASIADDDAMAFLAAAKDLVAALDLEDPSTHVSHIPVAMDGVCNGMQILSLLGRDPVGARETNCSSAVHRYDLYTKVAEQVVKQMESDNDPLAAVWLKRFEDGKGRKVVKRAVMTSPYGVTPRGIQGQLMSDGHTKGMDHESLAASYMKNQIVQAMSVVTQKAAELMAYFQDCANALAKHDITMSWLTPMGLRVTQSYWTTKATRIQTALGRVVLYEETEDEGLDTRKNMLAAAPNVVHSIDAALLQRVVLQLAGSGVSDTAMIHDSYGVHAAHVTHLHEVIRAAAVSIFRRNWLEDVFHAGLLSIAPEDCELPAPPRRGSFKITEVLSAPYFFS